jgi:replication factor C subunit 1
MARKMDDIRSFFSKGNSKTKTTKQKSKQAPRKPSVIYINDDDDDDVTIKTTRKGAKRKRLVISDSESEDEIFENAQKKPTESVAVVVSDKSSSKRQEISSAAEYFKNFPTKRPTQGQDDKKIIPETPPTNSPNSPQAKTPPTKKQKPSELMEMIKQKSPTPPLMVTPPKPKEVSTHSTKNHTPSTTPNTSTQPKPPSRSASYMAYLNRGGPSAPGSKPIPQGAENCLSGLTFVFTGVGESLDRDECSELAEKYGGRVTKSISRKTTYVVVGTGAGEKKIAEAQKLNINQIDEDGFLELIRTRDPPKYPPGKSVTPSGKKRKTSTGSKGTDVTTPTRKPIPPNPIRGDEPIALLESGTPSDQLVMDISGTSNTLATTSTDIVQSSESLGVVTPPISTPTRIKTNIVDLWVEKYKPATTKQIIGQQTNNSCMKRLTKWLMEWHVNNKPGQSTNGTTYKAALLSGPPGIGKTTTAVLVCQETGFSFTELNASASRSRKTLQETVASSLKSSTVDAYFTGNRTSLGHVCSG